jgi:hypothetical protein
MTIPGVDATVALSIVAAVGDFTRFRSPQKLVSYLGLNPRVRQSGGQPASHGRITKQGRAHARGMLVEVARVAAKIPGPLRAFFERVRSRRGMQVAVVATARKLACLCWQLITKSEHYAFARPSLTAQKMRKLQLRAGMPSRRDAALAGWLDFYNHLADCGCVICASIRHRRSDLRRGSSRVQDQLGDAANVFGHRAPRRVAVSYLDRGEDGPVGLAGHFAPRTRL